MEFGTPGVVGCCGYRVMCVLTLHLVLCVLRCVPAPQSLTCPVVLRPWAALQGGRVLEAMPAETPQFHLLLHIC